MIAGVSEKEDIIIKSILEPFSDVYEFYFYGSRVKGNFGKVSDLDILIKGKTEMPIDVLNNIKNQFDESSLPYIVNFSDYNKIDDRFYQSIKNDLIFIF